MTSFDIKSGVVLEDVTSTFLCLTIIVHTLLTTTIDSHAAIMIYSFVIDYLMFTINQECNVVVK